MTASTGRKTCATRDHLVLTLVIGCPRLDLSRPVHQAQRRPPVSRWRSRPAGRPNPVPFRRTAAFLLGLGAIEVALQSPIEHYDTTLFSLHMVQHILLTLVAPPLIAAGAPVTLLLRFTKPDVRRRWILPVLHSRPL